MQISTPRSSLPWWRSHLPAAHVVIATLAPSYPGGWRSPGRFPDSRGQTKDQAADITVDRRAPMPFAPGSGGPAAANNIAMPAQHRVRDTIIRRLARRARGITPAAPRSAPGPPGKASAAPWAAAAGPRAGGRSSRISASSAFLAPHSHDHAANRVTSRKTNRRHMTRDHRR